MTLFADRRQHVRYEVVGTLRGTLMRVEDARLVNISGSGALLEANRPIEIGSLPVIEMAVGDRPARVKARVQRRLAVQATGRFAIGVQFLSPPDSLVTTITDLIDGQPAG